MASPTLIAAWGSGEAHAVVLAGIAGCCRRLLDGLGEYTRSAPHQQTSLEVRLERRSFAPSSRAERADSPRCSSTWDDPETAATAPRRFTGREPGGAISIVCRNSGWTREKPSPWVGGGLVLMFTSARSCDDPASSRVRVPVGRAGPPRTGSRDRGAVSARSGCRVVVGLAGCCAWAGPPCLTYLWVVCGSESAGAGLSCRRAGREDRLSRGPARRAGGRIG